MTIQDQIIGFRRDRIGARLICMLNVMRLSRKFGVSGTYLWLREPQDSPYPELADPRDFLAADFVARHIRIIDQPPERGQRQNVNTVTSGSNVEGFAAMLAAGRLYECDSLAEIIRFMDEPAADAAADIRDIARQVVLAPPLAEALAKARGIVARAGGGDPVAIHVRRGDILDSDPWSYSAWPSKYVPDEFYRGFIDEAEGPVIAFSDTPAAVTHLAQGNPRVIAVGDLFDSRSLSVAARDLLELLLMADCAQVGAPGYSAFSRAATVMGRCEIAALPASLPAETRVAAYDALLERMIARPDSFFAPGDLAQSIAYGAKHAVTTGRAGELLDRFADRVPLLERFPFLYRELAIAAWTSGRRQRARRLAREGVATPLIRNRDRVQCRQLIMIAATDGPDGITRETEAQFLSMLLTSRAVEGPVMPELAHRLMTRPGNALAGTLLLAPELIPLFAEPPAEGVQTGPLLPLWLLRLDWSEFLRDAGPLHDLLQWPEMWPKMRPAAKGFGEVEMALGQGMPLPPADADAVARFGHCASALRLHGRLKRAFALLHWLDASSPGQALTHKRLADTCFAASNPKGGWRWLNSALMLAPENPMLRISAAIRAAEGGDRSRAARHLDEAEIFWPGLGLIGNLRRGLLRQRG